MARILPFCQALRMGTPVFFAGRTYTHFTFGLEGRAWQHRDVHMYLVLLGSTGAISTIPSRLA